MSVIVPVRTVILVMTALAGTSLQAAEGDSLDTAKSEAGSETVPARAVADAVLGKDQVKKQDEPRSEHENSEHEKKQEEYRRELEWREYPTDERGSDLREYWDPSRDDVLSPESKEHTPGHRDRAVSPKDFASTRDDSPGTDIGRAGVLESVGDKATLPVTTPPSDSIELPQKKGDSKDKGQAQNAKKSVEERR